MLDRRLLAFTSETGFEVTTAIAIRSVHVDDRFIPLAVLKPLFGVEMAKSSLNGDGK